MKASTKALTCVMLVVILLTFTLWRHNTLPDISGFVEFVQDTAGRINTLSAYKPENLLTAPRPSDENADFPEYELSEPLDAELEELLCNALRQHEFSVDVSSYHKTVDEIRQAMTAVRFSHPELFFVDQEYTYSYTGNYVTGLNFRYITGSKAEADTLIAEYETMLAEIVSGAPQDGSDFDKMLYIHDYFVREFCYDYTYTIRDAYTFFKERTGVCQAYMLAMIAVAEELGLQSVPVTSRRMNHAWNMIELDGVWYHVDITWDDTVSYPGHTSYRYFLQSDAGMVNIDSAQIDESMAVPDWHCDWSSTVSATDTRYDAAAWRNARTPIVKGNGQYHCVVSTAESGVSNVYGFVYIGAEPANMTQSFAVNGTWRLPDGAHYYVECYAGLAVYGNELLYNTPNSIRAHDLTTGEDRLVALDMTLGSRSIYGCLGVTEGGELSCVVAHTAAPEEGYPDYEIKTYQIS